MQTLQAEQLQFNMFNVEYFLFKASASLLIRQARVKPGKPRSKTLESYYREDRETTRGKPGDKAH